MAFLPFLGISAAAIGLVKLGVLAATVVYLKAMLAVAMSVALLLTLSHLWRWHKDSHAK